VNALRDQLTLLLLCLGPLAAAAGLRVDGEQVVVPFVDAALPTVCWSRRWVDVSCPGCGLTRGLVSAMHGDFAAAWKYNPAVFAAIAALVYQVVFRGLQVWRILRRRKIAPSGIGVWLFWVCLAAMLGQWTFRW
jgi:hypothetical protein